MNRLFRSLTLALALWALLSACTPLRLVSEYDAYTEQKITLLHRQVETLLTRLERSPGQPGCLYPAFRESYADMNVELNLLRARNTSRPRNDLTDRQLGLLADNLELLEELHRSTSLEQRCMAPESVTPLRSGFAAQVGAILKLELAKKRGESEPAGKP